MSQVLSFHVIVSQSHLLITDCFHHPNVILILIFILIRDHNSSLTFHPQTVVLQSRHTTMTRQQPSHSK